MREIGSVTGHMVDGRIVTPFDGIVSKRDAVLEKTRARVGRVADTHRSVDRRANVTPLRTEDESPDDVGEATVFFGQPLNDMGNAQRLMQRYGRDMLFVVGIGWHVWDGRRFNHDPAIVAVRRLAHDTAADMLAQAHDLPDRNKEQEEQKKAIIKFAVGCGNTSRINGMLAQAEPHSAVTTDDLDRDNWELNCGNGVLDLHTGVLRPHDQDACMTKLAPVDYLPPKDGKAGAMCPTWERTMLQIFNNDEAMVDYVQRALGYCLTGSTREQVVFILHGGGSNGKSLMLEVIASVLGDYAAQCPSDTFVESNQSGGIPNDIARLVGARLVSVVETEQDRKLAEGLVKQATGGDRMTARFLRQEFFEFLPRFKLMMATNHKPKVRGTDNAIWRRIRLIPFLVTFADADAAKPGQPIKNLDLKDQLMSEREGILRWLVDGCMRWQKNGLKGAPDTVMEATAEYRESQDATAGFIDECCHVSPGMQVAVGQLYSVYRNWCAENGEKVMPAKAFGMAMEEKGFEQRRVHGGSRYRKGLDLKEEFRRAVEMGHYDRN